MVTECCLSSTLHLKPVSTQSKSTQTWRPGFDRWSPRGGSPPSRRGSWPTESHRPPPSRADLFPSRRFRGEALRGRFLTPSGHLHPLLKLCSFTFRVTYRGPDPDTTNQPEIVARGASQNSKNIATFLMATFWWWVTWHMITEPGHVFVSKV